jgi:sugar lactone lactonase YvrE
VRPARRGEAQEIQGYGWLRSRHCMPFSQPTMCAFAGEDMTTLYVTSASDKMSDADKRREPLAGALIRLNPGLRGISRPFVAR